jgi:hypothetical protein
MAGTAVESPSQSSFPFKSYFDYVSTLYVRYPEYKWLHRFLSESGPVPSETRVLVIDSIDNKLCVHNFHGSFASSDGDGLRHALSQRSADIATRIVYVNYMQSWSIDRDVINIVGSHFQLNPTFLWGHLHHYYSSEDQHCPPDLKANEKRSRYLWISPLPSEVISLELSCGTTGLSALFLDDSTPNENANTSKLSQPNISATPFEILVQLTHIPPIQ